MASKRRKRSAEELAVILEVGDRLRKARRAAEVTQQEMARAMGVATAAIHNYESGRNSPPLVCLKAMAKAYGVTVAHLFGEG